jgi:hypothetical protein
MRPIRWQAILGAGLGSLLGAGCGATAFNVPGGDTGTGTSGTTGGSTSGGARYQGGVAFDLVTFAGKTSYVSGATFSVAPSASAATCAGGTQQGSCCYLSGAVASALEKAAPPTDISAGTLTLQDRGGTLVSLSFTPGQGYASVTSDVVRSLVWNPGDELGVVAAGASDGIGPFSGTVVAPAPLQALSPDLLTLATLSRSRDFRLTWTGIVGGTVLLTMATVNPASSSNDGVIVCNASSADGSLDVPAALLGNLPSGDHAVMELIMANLTAISAPSAAIQLGAAAVLLVDPILVE